MMNARALETGSLVLIGVAVMLGGGALLAELSRLRPSAVIGLVVVGVALLAGLTRGLALRGPAARLRVSRDVAFVASVISAIAFVASPARWSLGASIAAFEFGIVLELFGRFAGQTP